MSYNQRMDIKLETLKTKLITKGRHSYHKGMWDSDELYNDEFARLYYLFDGKGHLSIRDKKWKLTPKAIYLIPSGEDFMVHHSPEMDIASIHFTAVVDPMFDLFSMIKTPIEVLITDIGFFEKIITDILETSRYEQGLNPLILDSLIKVLLIPFLEKSEMNRENIRSYDPEFKNLLGYMSTNCEKELKISQLAESMHFHKNYFPSYFKKMTGKSPKRYIIDERIKRAKLLLLENRSSITEISDRLGFNDTCYFTRVFKEKTGMTPGTFAKQKVIL